MRVRAGGLLASRRLDEVPPMPGTEIVRHFQHDDEMPEERVRSLLTQVMSSPLVPRVAALIEKRLGRKLEPFDIWYDGFIAKQPEGDFSRLTRARYPPPEAYNKHMPPLLQALSLSPDNP